MKNNKASSFNNYYKNNLSLEIILIIFCAILAVTFKPVFFEILSTSGSADFHLNPSKCVFQGINHYESYLNNDGKCPVFLSQLGEYAQGFYILMWPFTLLEWNTAKIVWFVLNIVLIFFTVYIICKKFNINKIYTYILIFTIYCSIIGKVHLIMGQQAIFVLFFLTLPFVFKSKLFYILSGIAYFKYNIGYALFMFYLITKKYKILIFSLIPCIFGWLIYCFVTDSNLLNNLFQPVQLTLKNSGTINQVFLFSFMSFFFEPNSINYYLLVFLLSILINILVIYRIGKLNNDLQKLSCLCILILISIPHYGHDFVIITPLLIYAVYCYPLNKILARINLIGSIYFLNFYRVIELYTGKLFNYLRFNNDFVLVLDLIIPHVNILGLAFILILNLKNIKKNL